MAKGKNSGTPPATSATTATRQANEWGLPDWTDAKSYGEWENWKPVRWRWEFYRRKNEYRNESLAFFDVLNAREAAAHAVQQHKTVEARNRFSELADIQERAFSAFWKRWGYCEVLDPRVSNYPDDRLKTLPHDGFNLMDGSASSEAGISSIAPRIGQTAIVFDLDKPLKEQLQSASTALKKRQLALFGKPLQQRQQILKWIGYLRTLDAFEAKAPWAEIASLHPGTAQTDQTVRDIRDQAAGLRFNS